MNHNKIIASLTGVCKSYAMTGHDLTVLRDISFSIRESEFLAIMGPSGAGKSTLLNLLGLLDVPTKGSYELAGEDTSRFPDHRLSYVRNHRIGFVFQSFNLFPRLSVQQNIEVPMVYAEYPRARRRARARELAEQVGLGARLDHHPSQLSGGEMQRVAIARSLACEPVLILADEPTGNLDEHTGVEILSILTDLHEKGTTIALVTHNPDLLNFVQRVIELHDGRIKEDRRL